MGSMAQDKKTRRQQQEDEDDIPAEQKIEELKAKYEAEQNNNYPQ